MRRGNRPHRVDRYQERRHVRDGARGRIGSVGECLIRDLAQKERRDVQVDGLDPLLARPRRFGIQDHLSREGQRSAEWGPR